jgi:molybdenum cofactor cytidylyltransferase
VRATNAGVPGNPVILPRALFAAARQLDGDTGARQLIEDSGLPLIDIEIGEAASLDVDTPELLARAGGQLPAAATPTSAHAAPSRARSSGNQPA